MSVSKSGPLSNQSIWERVQGAVSQRANTAAVFAAVRAAAEQEGLALPQGTFKTVNQFRSIAVGLRNATQAFSAASPNSIITDQMIGTTPYARDLNAQILAPQFHVSYQQQVQTATGTETLWRSEIITGPLPSTVGDLLSLLNDTGDLIATSYGVTHMGIGQVQIAAI